MYCKIELIFLKKENMTWIMIVAIKSGLHTFSFAAGCVHVCVGDPGRPQIYYNNV